MACSSRAARAVPSPARPRIPVDASRMSRSHELQASRWSSLVALNVAPGPLLFLPVGRYISRAGCTAEAQSFCRRTKGGFGSREPWSVSLICRRRLTVVLIDTARALRPSSPLA